MAFLYPGQDLRSYSRVGEIFSTIFGLLIVGSIIWACSQSSYELQLHPQHAWVVQPCLHGLSAPKFSLLGITGALKDSNKGQCLKDPTMILATVLNG